MKTIREQAEDIIRKGNGYGIKCEDLLAVRGRLRRKKVWSEIVKIGAEEDAQQVETW